MKPSKIDPCDFKEVFGFTISEAARRYGFTKQDLFQIFSGEHKSKKLEASIIKLSEILDQRYKNEISMAEYKRERGKNILDQMKNMCK